MSGTQQGEQSVPNKQDEQELGFCDFTVIVTYMDCNTDCQHLVIASYVTTLDSNDNILCRACVPVTDSIHFKVLFDKTLYVNLSYAN